MIRSARSGLWTCSRCILKQQSLSRSRNTTRRWLTTAAATVPVDHTPPGANHDDALLRQLFDSPQTFKSFDPQPSPAHNVGLFRNRYLTSPEGFMRYAHVILRRSQRLVDKVLAARTATEYKAVVRDLDRLSDLLCRVLDMSDFVRVTHPDPRIQAAASQAWALVYQYMNQLNTATGLSDQLDVAMADRAICASWSEEEHAVAEMLSQDFRKSAIHLPKDARDEFVDISQRISEIGSSFMDRMGPEQRKVVLPCSNFSGLDPTLALKYTRRDGLVHLPTISAEATIALRDVHDEETRKAIFYASRTASERSVSKLETMLQLRARLAKLSGFESYGHMALGGRMMAKSPESVQNFLLSLASHNGPWVEQEMDLLLNAKKKWEFAKNVSTKEELLPWDKDYYMETIRKSMRVTRNSHDSFSSLSAYFSLGTVMQGLSRLFTRLYGIRLVPRETLPGETWHPHVRRLDVMSDTDGHIAVLYCDLFWRPDKSPNPAHYTVRCSREISDAEIQEVAEDLASREDSHDQDAPRFETSVDAANDGMHFSSLPSSSSSSSPSSKSIKQLPTIALVCDFSPSKDQQTYPHDPHSPSSSPPQQTRPALLDFCQVETLFHEMGHAVHSMLARTSLQNVSGTRCATDFAELPSTLMEHFCADPAVLALFARHYATDAPLPYRLVADRFRVGRRFAACDREHQIVLSLLDQAYHSPAAAARCDSTAIFHQIQHAHGRLPRDPATTRWQGFFGHLFGYGSTYYSYLFDQALSERVWKVVFSGGTPATTATAGGGGGGGMGKSGALDRENGERLKESLLKWGGGRDPWRCLADALGDERVRGGGDGAMAVVGTWGVRDRGG